MSVADNYRGLLAAYPARLRRRHGAELVTTLLEMSDDRPSRADRGRLVLDGLRERFRLPPKRPFALVAAVLAMLVGGALGAAAGSWVATAGYAELPPAKALAERALGPSGTDASGGRYYLNAQRTLAPGADLTAEAEQIRQRLVADGWTASGLAAGDGSDGVLRNVNFSAVRDGVRLVVYAYDYEQPFVQLNGWPTRPGAYVPLVIVGTLLGLAGGWLAGAALAHRIHAARRRLPSALLTGAGLVLLLVPAALFVLSLAWYLSSDLHGGLLHDRSSLTFGATVDMVRGWGLPAEALGTDSLTVLGFVAVTGAAILARPATGGESQELAQ